MMRYPVLIHLIVFLGFTAVAAQNLNMRPKQQIDAEKMALKFGGNDSSQAEHFKLLERDGAFLMVGARNAVYNVSLDSLTVHQKLEWHSSEKHVEECTMKGKSSEDCHNYIRVLIKQSETKILICGTNAFKPMCRQYEHADGENRQVREFDGFAISPFDPRDNSTALYLADEEKVIAGTVSDFGGTDPLIYSRPLYGEEPELSSLRTQRNDNKCLNDPDFVSSFEDEEHVYFWFRETAAEFNGGSFGPSRERAVYGRVARVCKRDRGGPGSYWDTWTTFVKVRLNCSLPGNVPFYFNELQATSEPVRTADGSQLVYALMSTPPGPLHMSAVCAFRMQDVRRIFEFGDFKAQRDPRSLWLPIAHNKQPKPRPGSCSEDSRKLSEETASFIRRNPLMADSVSNYFSAPLFIDNSLRTQFTQIAVHQHVLAASGRTYDVIFVGTDDGRVLKMVNTGAGRTASSVLIESVRLFGLLQAVRNLLINTDGTDGQLVAVSQEEVRSVPLHHCSNQLSCSACVRLQDPYCAWDLDKARCVGKIDGSWINGDFVQSIPTGRSSLCPEGDIDPELYVVNELYPQHVAAEVEGVYSAESMAIGIIATLAVASTIGVLAGYRLARWKMLQDGISTASSSDYDSHSLGRSRLTHHDAAAKLEHLYGTAPSSKFPDNNMLLTMPGHVPYCSNTLKPEKNLLSSTLNNGTLPKDYKVRKVYV